MSLAEHSVSQPLNWTHSRLPKVAVHRSHLGCWRGEDRTYLTHLAHATVIIGIATMLLGYLQALLHYVSYAIFYITQSGISHQD